MIVLTGFRAFPGVADNPTQTLVDHFAAQPQALPTGTLTRLLDVDYRTVGPALDKLLAVGPSTLILTGYSSQARAITLEAQASGLCAPDKPDVCGFVPSPAPAATLRTTLNLTELQAKVAHVAPCTISHDAGQYLCNYAYRHALARAARDKLPVQVLFVHVPAISGTDLAQTAATSLPLAAMAAALAMIVREAARYSPPV